MTDYPYAAKVDADIKATIALALDASVEDWREGRSASPAPLDYVRITEVILMERMGLGDGPGEYHGSTPEGRDLLADALDEWMTETTPAEWSEIVEFIVDGLVAE